MDWTQDGPKPVPVFHRHSFIEITSKMAGAGKGNKHESVLLHTWNNPVGAIIPKFYLGYRYWRWRDVHPSSLIQEKYVFSCIWDSINSRRKDGSSWLEMIPQVGPPCWKMTIQANPSDSPLSIYRQFIYLLFYIYGQFLVHL